MLHLKHQENNGLAKLTDQIIEAAFAGFEEQKHKIDAQIAELRAMLNGTPAVAPATVPTKSARGGKRKFSAAAKQKMREAQQRRWAAIKGTGAPAVATKTAAKPKRKMSAAGRKAIAAAQKKRWAAKKAAA
jgi:hypothetical protein